MFLVVAGVLLALWVFVTVTSKVTSGLIHLLLLAVAVFALMHFLTIG